LRLPIYPDLFEIFSGSGGDAWRSARQLAGIEAPRSLPAMGWMRVRSSAAALGGRISESDPSLRLIVQNRIYGSNSVDCSRSLCSRARDMGNVSGQADGAETGSGYLLDQSTFGNGDPGDPHAFAVSGCFA